MSRGFLVAVGVLVVLAGAAAVLVSRSAPRRVPLPAPGTLQGTWEAQGVVTESRGAADQPAGTHLRRRWVFYDHCAGSACHQWLARETSDVVERARLVRSGDRLTAAHARRTDGCNTSATGVLLRTFHITAASGGRLKATEDVKGTFPFCTQNGSGEGHLTSTLTWSLRKVSSDCTGSFPDCRDQP
jgi:hypothetical protein